MAANPGVVPWLVFDEEGRAVEPVRRYLIVFVARYNRPGRVRSYAFDLLRWWRWLRVVDVPWNQATPAEGRDFALWLGATVKVPNAARTVSTATAGTINPITKKPYLDDRCKPRTIRHSNAVIRSFCTFWIEASEGPLINPVPLARSERRRPHTHHNPLIRIGTRADSGTTRKSYAAGPGRCQMSSGTSCSPRSAPTATGRSSRSPSATAPAPRNSWV